MFHIALGFFLFPYKFPQSFFKQSCQFCLFQSLIYKEPMDGSKYQVGKLLHFHYKPAFNSPFLLSVAEFSAHTNSGRQERECLRINNTDGFQLWPKHGIEPLNQSGMWVASPSDAGIVYSEMGGCNLGELCNTTHRMTPLGTTAPYPQ